MNYRVARFQNPHYSNKEDKASLQRGSHSANGTNILSTLVYYFYRIVHGFFLLLYKYRSQKRLSCFIIKKMITNSL